MHNTPLAKFTTHELRHSQFGYITKPAVANMTTYTGLEMATHNETYCHAMASSDESCFGNLFLFQVHMYPDHTTESLVFMKNVTQSSNISSGVDDKWGL